MFLFFINILSYDIWFYLYHRLSHSKYLYKYHKKHHEKNKPNWYDTYYASKLENTLNGIGIFFPIIYFQTFNLECILSLLFVNIRGAIRHETRLKYIFGEHHLIHHKCHKYNYGEWWIDYLMGSLFKK